jgi:hypothetical protein
MKKMTEYYRAAAIIFYRDKDVIIDGITYKHRQVYLQYEHKFNEMSHFGGKRETYDISSWQTAFREIKEETAQLKTPIYEDKENLAIKQYFHDSKMIVYYIKVAAYEYQGNESNWICIGSLPHNIRPHVISQIDYLFFIGN